MRPWLRWSFAAAAAVALLGANGHARAAEVRPSAEAWYPVGVGAVTQPTYPADTLHVGVFAGQETDRTYLRFDVGGDELDAATLRIRVDPDAGTSAPETAVLLACAVPGGFEDGGGEDVPPEVDCELASVEASYAEGVFTIDALPFADDGAVQLALLSGGGTTWHVAFDGRERDGAEPASLLVTEAPTGPGADSAAGGSPAPATTVPPGPLLPSPTFAVPAAPSIAGPAATVPAPAAGVPVVDASGLRAAPVAVASSGDGFRYSAIFALPIALLVLVGLVGDGLLKPVRLREDAT